MKKAFLILFLFFTVSQAFPQKDDDEINERRTKALIGFQYKDKILVDVFTDLWLSQPGDSIISTWAINRGCNVNYMFDKTLGTSHFSFAIGLGIGSSNLYSDAMPVRESVSIGDTSFEFTGNTIFKKLPKSINGVETDFKNNKLTLIYVDIPLEFRFRTSGNEGALNPWTFKFAIGFKAGFLISSHTKYRGDDIRYNYISQSWDMNSDLTVKNKSYKVPNLEFYRMGPTLRFGWGWVNISAYYSLTKLFKKGKSPYEMYPISIGLTITPPF